MKTKIEWLKALSKAETMQKSESIREQILGRYLQRYAQEKRFESINVINRL